MTRLTVPHRRPTVHRLIGMVVCGLVAAVAGCGGAAGQTGDNGLVQEYAQILGHQPAGVALEVAKRRTVIVVNDEAYPPFSYRNSEGQMAGFDVEVARAAADILGVRLRQVQIAWDLIPDAIEAGRLDVSIGSMTATTERQEYLGFTSPYYWTMEYLAVRRGTPPIQGPSDMAGKTIGCGVQSTAYQYLERLPDVEVRPYRAEVDGLVDLKRGEIDGYVSSLNFLMQSISSGEPFELSGSPLYYTAASFAYKKGEDDWGALLEYAVRTLHSEGALTATSQRWFWGFDLTQPPPAGVHVEGGAPQ